MPKLAKLGATLVTSLLLSASWSAAQSQTDEVAMQQLREALNVAMRNTGGNAMQFAAQALQQLDSTGEGIDSTDISNYESFMTAQIKSGIIAQKLRMDLDGDLIVTEQEVEAVARIEFGRRGRQQARNAFDAEIKQYVENIMVSDTNNDGKIEGKELAASRKGDGFQNGRQNYMSDFGKALIAVDPNKDGRVTEAEVLTILGATLSSQDDCNCSSSKKN